MDKKNAVILVNYRGCDDTFECIESIKRSSAKVSIIVVDNASENGDYERLKSREDCIAILSEKNLGFAGGNNLGIDYALNNGYENIILLNNDTVIAVNMLEELLKNLDEDVICSPCMYYYYEQDVVWYGGGHINKYTGRAIHNHMGSKEYGEPGYYTFATGCCMAMSRGVIEKLGHLEDSYFMYCEDAEYCLRAMRNGINIKYVPTARLWHKVSRSTGGGESALFIYYMTRNRLRYIKDYKEVFSITAYPFTVISRYLRALQYLIKGKREWRVFVKAIRDDKQGVIGRVDCFT